MKRAATYVLIAAVLAVLVLGEMSLWQECRNDHSVAYCLRVLGK